LAKEICRSLNEIREALEVRKADKSTAKRKIFADRRRLK